MKLTPSEKRKLLVKLIEHWVMEGIDISSLVGRPLSYFDWVVISQAVKDYELKECN